MVKDNKTVIIMVSGKAESGKNTCARLFAENCQLSGVRMLSFAEPVKEFARLLGWNGVKDEYGRAMLQWLGDGVKQFNSILWATKAAQKIIELKKLGYRCFIFSDCRYLDEISFFKDRYSKVFVIRVNRPRHKSSLTEEQLKHPSECALDDYDFDAVITNDGNMSNLEDHCYNAIGKIKILGDF